MNKICTSLEQSQKLIELGIDINTADMYYEEVCNLPKAIVGNYILHNQCMEDKDYKKLSNPVLSPAWSLSALLELIPENIDDNTDDFSQLKLTKKSVAYYYGDGALRCGFLKDNFIDAVFQMICWLKENEKL